MKTAIYDAFPSDHEITHAEWKNETRRFMHIFPEEVEEKLLEDIQVDGKIDRTKL
jgi:hypothetical protein